MRRPWLLLCPLPLALCPLAHAQEAMFTAAATMPSPGTGVFRPQFHYFRSSSNPNDATDSTSRFEARAGISYGLDRALALALDVPFELERKSAPPTNPERGWDFGIADLDAMLKYRVYKDDADGVNTLRVALLAGASFASGDDHDFSSTSINPHAGVVATLVRERHGFNAEAHYYWNTGGDVRSNLGGEGPADALRLNTAYLYRLYPSEYSVDSKGAWYATAELTYLYETTADHDLRFAPGLMYEGWSYAFEVMLQLPVYQHADHRPEFSFGIGVGVRLSF